MGLHTFLRSRGAPPVALKADPAMKFIKGEFSRFFALGFAGGALLVLGAMGIGSITPLAHDIVPPAQAAQSH